MDEINFLAVQIGCLYHQAQTDVYRMHRVDEIVEKYLFEIDPGDNKSVYECVKELPIKKAEQLLNEMLAVPSLA